MYPINTRTKERRQKRDSEKRDCPWENKYTDNKSGAVKIAPTIAPPMVAPFDGTEL